MGPRTRWLLAASGLAVLCVAVAMGYVVTRSGRDVPRGVVADGTADRDAGEPPAGAEGPALPRQSRPPVVPAAAGGQADETSRPEPAPAPTAAETPQERDARAQKVEAIVARSRESLIRDLKLDDEQIQLAEPVFAFLREQAALIVDIKERESALKQQLRQQEVEQNWTPEERQLNQDEAEKRFFLECGGDIQRILEEGIVHLEQLRPCLSEEQMPALDQTIERQRETRRELLRRTMQTGPVP